MEQIVGGTLWHIDKNALDAVAAGTTSKINVNFVGGNIIKGGTNKSGKSFQMWQASNTRIKGKPYSEGDTSYDDANEIILPIDTLEISADPYVPEGGTVLELYDDRKTFRPPSFGYIMMLEYNFERTDYRPDVYNTIADLIRVLTQTTNEKIDFFVRYNKTSGFVNEDDNPGSFAEYKLVDMIPEITPETAQKIFAQQAREKPREIEFQSQYVDRSFNDVEWVME